MILSMPTNIKVAIVLPWFIEKWHFWSKLKLWNNYIEINFVENSISIVCKPCEKINSEPSHDAKDHSSPRKISKKINQLDIIFRIYFSAVLIPGIYDKTHIKSSNGYPNNKKNEKYWTCRRRESFFCLINRAAPSLSTFIMDLNKKYNFI